jgi:hypothetical protein
MKHKGSLLFQIHFNIILACMHRSHKWSIPVMCSVFHYSPSYWVPEKQLMLQKCVISFASHSRHQRQNKIKIWNISSRYSGDASFHHSEVTISAPDCICDTNNGSLIAGYGDVSISAVFCCVWLLPNILMDLDMLILNGIFIYNVEINCNGIHSLKYISHPKFWIWNRINFSLLDNTASH